MFKSAFISGYLGQAAAPLCGVIWQGKLPDKKKIQKLSL